MSIATRRRVALAGALFSAMIDLGGRVMKQESNKTIDDDRDAIVSIQPVGRPLPVSKDDSEKGLLECAQAACARNCTNHGSRRGSQVILSKSPPIGAFLHGKAACV